MTTLLAPLVLTLALHAHAAPPPYADVPPDIWYAEAVRSMLDDGILDATKTEFRGGAPATRAELLKLIVELNGGILGDHETKPAFSDVPVTAWYHPYFAEAKEEAWVLGDGSCALQASGLCNARPDAVIARAEAIALIVRAYGLETTGPMDRWKDAPEGAWFLESVQAAADNCVIAGTATDDAGRTVRPFDPLNRAEMAMMLHNLEASLSGSGPACEARGEKAP